MLKKIYKKIKTKYKTIRCFISDYNDFVNIQKYVVKKDELCANIMLHVHQLEKGMSFTDAREFGGEKAYNLARMLVEYNTLYANDEYTSLAYNVLYKYLKYENSTKEQDVRGKIESLLKEVKLEYNNNIGGVKIVSKPVEFNTKVIEDFYYSRHSVREFSDKLLEKNDILAAMNIAISTPSSCNRQASRVHVISDKEQIRKIVDNQLGDQGWCNNATTLFIITVNRAFFTIERERYQALVDGGMFAINFAMGLHLNNIATCFKMYVRDSEKEYNFKKLANIPNYEQPIVLLLAGYYKDSPIKSPKSERFSPSTQIIFHE